MERNVHDVTTATHLEVAPQTPQASWTEFLHRPMEVAVVFTNPQSTFKALKAAAASANGLDARVRLIVLQVVSHALPLDEPPVPVHFTEERVLPLVSDLGVDTRVDILLCRNKREGLMHALKPRSLVVVGSRRRWWPTWEKRLAKQLRRGGHEVILTETE